MASAAAIPSLAWAQCSPDPSQAGVQVSCSGSDTNGYVINTNASPLTVAAGASVTNTGAPAITVSIPSSGGYTTRSASITVNGTVSATDAAGINILSGPLGSASYDFYGTGATVTVGAAGSISGTYGITAGQSPGNNYAPVGITLDNAGSISGTSGVALSAPSSYSYAPNYFTSLYNRATGSIGAIQANIASITNEGSINGGTLTALAGTNSSSGSITNSGTITASGSNTTIVNYASIRNSGTISNSGSGRALDGASLYVINQVGGTISAKGDSVLSDSASGITLNNSGTVTNTGTGFALSGTSLNVTNNAGGVIATGPGNTALNASSGITLTNLGTITGNIVGGSGGSTSYGSTIDSTGGTVTGNLTLGAANDTLVATIKNGSLHTGISGTIDGGGGTNMVQLKTSVDTTLSSALTLPTGFTAIDYAPAGGTTLTLANTYPTSGSLLFDGTGTLDNQGTLSGSGQLVGQNGFLSGYGGVFKNSGTINSANSNTYISAVNLTGAWFTNTGTLTATGNAVYALYGSVTNNGTITAGNAGVNAGSLTNTGTITAGGTAVSTFVSGNNFTNSGIIRSTGGTGAALSFSCTCNTGTNSGTISGAIIGLDLMDGTLVNTGTITSAGTGVRLGYYSTLDNRAGGVVSGSGTAISGNGNYKTIVINAGTINGDVNIANTYPYTTGRTGSYYVAAAGGILNGNLTLGLGDTLVADYASAGTGGFVGIKGTVTANRSYLIYAVSSDAKATTALPSGFSSVGYQLSNNATLTVAGTGAASMPLTLTGAGNVAVSGTLSTANQSAVQSIYSYDLTASALTVTNSGAISATRDTTSVASFAAVALGTGDSLVNTGSITMKDTTGTNAATYGFAVVSGAGSVTNSGTITGIGINAVNAGNPYGSSSAVINSGTISSDLAAVQLSGTKLTNSGTLASTGGAAITNFYAAYGGNTITNLAGGVITGVGTAVQIAGGTLDNAGTINGNVDLGYGNYNSGYYIANGGTINGNLAFGNANNLLAETGSGYGVTGTITAAGNASFNWIGHQRSAAATVTLGSPLLPGFGNEVTLAAGAGSRVTITGPANYTQNIYVGGDGAIINQLATTGFVEAGLFIPAYYGIELGGFSNRANIAGVLLNTGTFDNAATIGSSGIDDWVVNLQTAKALTFTNSGTILNNGHGAAVDLAVNGTPTGNSTLANSGAINGLNLSILTAGGTSASIVNSGTITGASQNVNGFTVVTPAIEADVYGAKTLSLTNSGTINGAINLIGSDATLVNTGTIVGTIGTGGGNDSLTLGGTVTGAIRTGAGNDSIALNGVFSGSIDGGTGSNTLSISGGSQSSPVALTSVNNIATLNQTGGFATVSGVGTFGSVTLTGGRLVGLAGSVLNAASFTVGSNATFGSAGTVNGNLGVSGILSPGASPGTMTVNGNVTLNSGSVSLFEITPTVSDKLVVNGKVAIQQGSTLQIAASAPVKVGSTLDLITASGGVSGSYDTVTGIAGSVRKLANGDLGLLVQFANPADNTPQVRRAIAYVNSAMAAASAPAALTPALSALQDGNAAPIASAFARLTPEPYADALQIGTETALSLAGTARTIGEGETGGDTHLFAFGQMLGSLRQFASNEAQGVSHATINGFGTLGGLGVAGHDYAVSAYVGWVDQNQSIANLSASTKSRGMVGGVAARFGGATRVTLSANYDNAHALTRRYVPDAGTISTAYALPSWSFDASLSRAVPLGQGWVLRPQVGTTWVMTSHDAIAEASTHPFALSVDKADVTEGFVDAGLGFETAPDATGPWKRFLTLGARYRVQGEQAVATAALAGYTSSLVALGVTRNRVDVTLATGFEYRLAPGASFFVNAAGELGKEGKRESVTTGLRFRL